MSDRTAHIRETQGKKRKEALTAVLAVIAVYAVFHILGIGCPIRWITGISCAGCGMTRAYLSLLHLEIRQAFIYHPLFWSVPMVLLVLILRKAGKIPERAADFILYFTAFFFVILYFVRLFNPADTIVTARPGEGLIGKAFFALRRMLGAKALR